MRSYQPAPQLPAPLHPLDAVDRCVIEALPVRDPSNLDIVNAARLITRYRDSLLSADLHEMLCAVLQRWGLTISQLNARSLAIWQSGWRPSLEDATSSEVGSGADVEG